MLKALKLVAINILAFVLIFSVFEGAASLLFTAVRIHRATGVKEQFHSTHDPTLGWVNMPNVRLPDLYGPGISLHTNAQAFRGDHDIARAVPAGKLRIMCSGDSFTLGYGVRDNETWCHQLSVLDPRLETVNMGQGGYGLDQAYLWYKRAGLPLDHQVHLFAFITDDFLRMQFDDFVGYGKPLLGVRGDSIAVLNAPVPKRSSLARWWLAKGYVAMNLNIVQLANRVFGHPPEDRFNAARNDSTRTVVARIFQDLARINAAKNSRLVLVLLPGASDYRRDEPPSSLWRRFVIEEAARQGIQLIDLFEPLRRLPPTQVDSLFLQDGHYSVRGNEWVARAIFGALGSALAARSNAAAAH